MSTNRAVVTVTDQNFFKGTLALLYSIVKHNNDLISDFIIIESDLSDSQKKVLSVFPNLSFVTPGAEIIERVAVLKTCIPSYKNTGKKFFSLEVFNLHNHDQLLFLDSDMICLGSLSSLFENISDPLLVAPDRYFYLNIKRNVSTFLPCPAESNQDDNTCLECFNSGMMLINKPLLKKNSYNEMIKLLSPMIYAEIQTGHSDQYLLNRYFQNTFKFVSGKYNYLLHVNEEILKRKGLIKEEAVLLHFVKYPKPWVSEELKMQPKLKIWREIYLNCIDYIVARDHSVDFSLLASI